MNDQEHAHVDLFSGIGGFALAAKWARFKTVQFVEIDNFCQRILSKHWPHIPLHNDIKTFSYSRPIELLTAGFPCQPFSVSGKKKGKDDNRYLWPEVIRVIRETRPVWFVGENVPGIIPMLDTILEDLERENYTWWACLIPASLIGAPHKRERVWIIAHANGKRCNNGSDSGEARYIQADIQRNIEKIQSEWSQFIPEPWKTFNAETWLRQSPLDRIDDGIPNKLDRNKSLGNAIVPQVVYPILKMIGTMYDRR